MYRVDFSLPAFRWIYEILYQRVLDFSLSIDEPEAIVKARFAALVLGDPNVYLLIHAPEDLTKIQGHCLFRVQNEDLYVEQLKVDSGRDESFVRECIAYCEAIPGVKRLVMLCDENKYKAYKKKYEFSVQKVLMYREVK